MALPQHKEFWNSDSMKKQLTALTGSELKGKQFATALLQITATNNLAECDPKSVYMAATHAATLNLSVQPMLGHCYFIPFRNKQGKNDVQFILGYKGMIQLCLRTGEYERINAQVIYKNENPKWDKINEVLSLNGEGSGEIAGFYAHLKLKNGFFKAEYWSFDRVLTHAKRFTKQKDKDGNLANVWKTDFEAMALKTVLRSILTKYGLMTPELESALSEEVENEVKDTEVEEVIKSVNDISDYDFLLEKIKTSQDEKDLLAIREDVLELAEFVDPFKDGSSLVELFNKKCIELDANDYIL